MDDGFEDSGHREPNLFSRDHPQEVTSNRVEGLQTSTRTAYKAIKITPAQALLILRSMMQNILHFTMVSSWPQLRFGVQKCCRFAGLTSSGKSGRSGSLSHERRQAWTVKRKHPLRNAMHRWAGFLPITYAKPTDFVFPSSRNSGKKPICSSVFCRVHLRPAAKKAGVVIPDGHRWSPQPAAQPVELVGQ